MRHVIVAGTKNWEVHDNLGALVRTWCCAHLGYINLSLQIEAFHGPMVSVEEWINVVNLVKGSAVLFVNGFFPIVCIRPCASGTQGSSWRSD